VLSSDVAQWDKWIAQAEQDSKKSDKKFLLLVKYNNVDEFVFIDGTENLELRFTYKGKNVYKLSDFLGMDDSKFFNSVLI
jgi:hypothetical protein